MNVWNNMFKISIIGFFVKITLYFISEQISDINIPGRSLFITAHPDDEVMFFGPSILRAEDPYILCLSRGAPNGTIRSNELKNSCKKLGIQDKCFIPENDTFKDGFEYKWKQDDIRRVVNKYIEKIKPDRIITFDEFGVSHHPNHIAIPKGLKKQFNANVNNIDNTPIFFLKTKPIYLKYTENFATIIYYLTKKNKNGYFLVTPIKSRFQMKIEYSFMKHKSQIVWYRYLWLIFSRFLHFNHLIPANT